MKIKGIFYGIFVIILKTHLLSCQDVTVRVKQGTLVGVGFLS